MTNWGPDDSDRLRDYLQRTDSKLIARLTELIPAVNAQTIEATALQAKEQKGARDTIAAIQSLAERQPQRVPIEPQIDVTAGLPR